MEIGLIVIGIFLLLALLRVPLPFALLIPSVLYLLVFGFELSIVANRMMNSMNSFVILAIPLFIFVGNLMNSTGFTEKIFTFAKATIGHIRGGLAQVNIIASLIFSGMSGSALADIGGIGRVMIESMEEEGYERDYAASLTGASATVGPLFPPSIPLIMYGVLAETSVLDLLIGGVGPALLTVVGLSLMTAFLSYRRDLPSTGSRSTFKEWVRPFFVATPALLAPVILIGGMITGFYGPTAIAAITAIYAVAVGLILYRELTLDTLWEAGVNTVYPTARILFIIAAAAVFSWVLSIENIDVVVADAFELFGENPLLLLLVLNVLLLFLGAFLETLTIMVLAIPIFVPPLVGLGVDPVHLGIIVVYNLMVGLLTPPFGLAIYMVSDVGDVSPESVVSEMLPYYVVLIASLLLITYFPQISLFLTNL